MYTDSYFAIHLLLQYPFALSITLIYLVYHYCLNFFRDAQVCYLWSKFEKQQCY